MDFEGLFDSGAVSEEPTRNRPVIDEGRFDIRVDQPRGETTKLTVTGPLDLAALPRFTTIVRAHVDSGCPAILLDLSGVTFLSACGIEALLDIQHRARSRDKHLALVTGTHAVDRPLQVLDLTTRFSYGDPPMTHTEPASEEVPVPASRRPCVPEVAAQPASGSPA